MHSSQDPRIVKCLDALHYSFEMLKLIHSPLYTVCAGIPVDNSKLVEALWRSWSFVDVLYRIREVTQAMPGLGQKGPEVRTFLEATTVVETYRHYIQHLRSELSKKDPNPFPVWGSLSWVDPEDNRRGHLVLAGARLDTLNYSFLVYDLKEQKWVSRVCLGAAGLSFNFDLLYEAAMTFSGFVLPWAFSAYEPGITRTSQLSIITTTLHILPSDTPPVSGNES